MIEPTPPRPPLSFGGGVLVLLGGLLLVFPGGCSLFAIVATLAARWTNPARGENYDGAVYIVSGAGLLIALAGFFIARAGWRWRRAGQGEQTRRR
jgi:uncharacterized membrane protein YphA (DoxX/SURF4 family)